MGKLKWEERTQLSYFKWVLKLDGTSVVGLRHVANVFWDMHTKPNPQAQTHIRHLGENLTDEEAKAMALVLYRMGE